MSEVGEDENMKMEHRMGYMALVGTIAPMVGLLGTVDGMVASFSVIATSTSTPKPSELATGISMALVTTLAGLVIAIPALMVFNIQKNYAARLMFETGIFGENLLQQFSKLVPARSRRGVGPASIGECRSLGLKSVVQELTMKLCKKASSDVMEGDFTPMIDMVFQLIAFFMVLINFNEADTNERIQLPGSELARPPDGPITFPITLHVTRDGTVIIGGDEIQVAGLSDLLREQSALELENRKLTDATVIIRGDADAKTGKVQEVIQECQKNRFEKLRSREGRDRPLTYASVAPTGTATCRTLGRPSGRKPRTIGCQSCRNPCTIGRQSCRNPRTEFDRLGGLSYAESPAGAR